MCQNKSPTKILHELTSNKKGMTRGCSNVYHDQSCKSEEDIAQTFAESRRIPH